MQTTISVIIPVYREAAVINRTLAELGAPSAAMPIEIIVVDGHPAGTTLEAIARRDVRKVIGPRGRGPQMNRGAALASGEVLLFLHADTLLPANAFAYIAAALEGARAVGGAFSLGIRSPRAAFRVIETAVAVRSRLTRIPYGDQGIFLKRRFFAALGGFTDIPIMEDVELMRRVKRSGRRVVVLPQCVQTSARRWEQEGVVFCTLRNWLLVTLFLCGASPRRLARFYR
jgi:rSAM/selenodomain-associated transferase 2